MDKMVLKWVVRLCLSVTLLVIGSTFYAPKFVFSESFSGNASIAEKDVLQAVMSVNGGEEIEAKMPYYFFSSLYIAPYTLGATNENPSENSLLKYIAIHRTSSSYQFLFLSFDANQEKDFEQKLMCQSSASRLCRWQV